MFKSISLTIIATFLGQAFGFFADIFIANSFGTSWKADAYFLAMAVTVILADSFMTCINAVFIPVYESFRKQGSHVEFFNGITTLTMLVVTGVFAVAFFFTPSIITLIAGKFSPEARALTITLTRMLLVLAVTMPLATILSSRLNAHDHFALPALGKSFNIGFLIVSLVLLKRSLDIYSLPVGFIAGNIFFIVSLVFLFRRSGLWYSPRLDLRHPAVTEIAVLLLPLVAATMVNYANIFIERTIAASFSEGSISALNYAFKVVNIPVNLFILAGMTVLMPVFSKHAANDNVEALREMTLRGLRFVSFFILPLIAGLMVFRVPLIRLLYERGAFSVQSTATTSEAVLFYAFGIFGLSAVSLMSRVFYALKDMKTLAVINVCIMVLNIVLMITLSRAVGFIGIPLTFSIASTVHMVVMILVLDSRLKTSSVLDFLRAASAHAVAAAVMGAASYISWRLFSAYLDTASKPGISFLILISGAIGLACYLVICKISGVGEVRSIMERLYRSR